MSVFKSTALVRFMIARFSHDMPVQWGGGNILLVAGWVSVCVCASHVRVCLSVCVFRWSFVAFRALTFHFIFLLWAGWRLLAGKKLESRRLYLLVRKVLAVCVRSLNLAIFTCHEYISAYTSPLPGLPDSLSAILDRALAVCAAALAQESCSL